MTIRRSHVKMYDNELSILLPKNSFAYVDSGSVGSESSNQECASIDAENDVPIKTIFVLKTKNPK